MKTFPVFLSFAMLCGTLAGQEYVPTAIEGAKWVIRNSETPLFPYISFVQFIEGDTTIDDRSYKKLYERTIDHIDEEFEPPFSAPYSLFPERRLLGVVRDDREARSVYGRLFQSSGELGSDTLWHDYTLGVGDTLVGVGFDTSRLGAATISSIELQDIYGQERRVITSTAGTFYEGVGSSKYGPVSGGTIFLTACCLEVLVDYCVADFNACNLFTVSTENPAFAKVNAYPNPVMNELNIANLSVVGANLTIEIIGLTGRTLRVWRQSYPDENTLLDMSGLPLGHQVVRVTGENGTLIRRLVKR